MLMRRLGGGQYGGRAASKALEAMTANRLLSPYIRSAM